MANTKYKNWQLETDEAGIAWLSIDKAKATTNVLSSDVMEELDQVLIGIHETRPKGLLILSAKPGGFIAGADVSEFSTIESHDQALDFIKRGQSTLDRLEALPFPTVCFDRWILCRRRTGAGVGLPLSDRD